MALMVVMAQDYSQRSDTLEQQPLALLKPIENLIVEEYETAVLDLSDYFSGSLLDFRLNIEEIN